MNRTIKVSSLLFGTGLTVLGWLALQTALATSSQAQSRAMGSEVGRYRLFSTSSELMYIIDTKTGEVWQRGYEGRKYVWRTMGSPTSGK